MSDRPTSAHDGRVAEYLSALGRWCWRRRWLVIGFWLTLTLAGGSVAGRLSERLLSGSGNIANSASLHVDEALHGKFHARDAQSLLLVFQSTKLATHPAEFRRVTENLRHALSESALVAAVRGDSDFGDPRLIPKKGSGSFLLIEVAAVDVLATEQRVPPLRELIAPVMHEAKQRLPDLQWAVTGRAALTYDLNRFSADDSARAEFHALPLTLAVLLVAFGSIMAACLPLLLAIVTRSVVLGLVFSVAGLLDVSNIVQSIVTMLAIALGIDYSLFLVHRFRQEHRECADGGGLEALGRAMAQAGTAVFYSAITVAIGIGALLVTPLMQTRSIGLGGVLAVLISLLASLTLVPALISLLGSRGLDWPALLSGRLTGERSHRAWSRWGDAVVQRPGMAILSSLALLGVLAAPAAYTKFGFPEGEFLPADLEYARGLAMLDDMELKGLVSPVLVVVNEHTQKPAIRPDTQDALSAFVASLEDDHRVGVVLGPVPSSRTAPTVPASVEEALGAAFARESFISEDRRQLLFRIIPSGDSTLADLRALAGAIPAMLKAEGLTLQVGGQAQYYNDFDRAVWRSYPLTIGLVLTLSALILLLFFRAPLASAKALLLNLLSVAAGYGTVVLVFQLGHGATLFGQAGGTGAVPMTVPLVIFCILFGLSMDYEIFLLSRVRAIFVATGDNVRSIREGVADTGAVITSAALIMVVVFGAFAFARIVIVQMIGLGLAVAVLVDATLIRSILGPALMQVAGKWNWWIPGQSR
jgi:RND superfamily putative drug exporter